MILYSAADLIWATRIKGAADALGVPCRPARSVEMLEARLADSDVRALIVDLDAPDPGVSMALIRRVAEENRGRTSENGGDGGGAGEGAIRVVAFGPHVATDLLRAAREAGAHDVMVRGAFAARLGDVLRALNARR